MERRAEQAVPTSGSVASSRSPKRKSLVNDLRMHTIISGRNKPGESSVTKGAEAPSKTIMPESHVMKQASESDWNGNESIQVGVRVRPLTSMELMVSVRAKNSPVNFRPKRPHPNDAYVWSINSETITLKGTRKAEGRSSFSFDSIFDETATTGQVYNAMIQPIVRGVATGQNGTVFCYGQTGSGKTYTMQGHDGSHNDVGIVQMAAGDLFKNIEETSAERDYVVRVSYIEIYNETVRDLLDKIEKSEAGLSDGSGSRGNGAINRLPSQDFRTLAVREDPKRGGVYVDCKERQVHDAAALIDVLQDGNRNRSFACTSMNERSSRSHAIFRITLESRRKTKKFPDGIVRISNLNLVDLAGSENGHQTSTNRHRREGGKINQSLLSLSQVIHALSTPPEKRQAYINYRDSKLTRLLQPYLSGNALIAVLCCVTPCILYVEETRFALKFAARAKLITTKPTVNEVMDDSEIIKKLQHDLEKARSDLKRLEMREHSTEQSTSEALDEFQRLKTLIFGNGDLPTFQTGHTQISTCNQQANIALVSPSPARGSSRMSTGRLSLRSPSRANALPPSEVLIMKEPLRIPTEYGPASRLKDAEQRVEFLKSKLDATEDLVESLFQDVESARGCIHKLVFKNVRLTNQIEKLNIELEEAAREAETQKFQQCLLLKYCVYGGLFFFVFGYHDLFFCAVLFLWLSLETLTQVSRTTAELPYSSHNNLCAAPVVDTYQVVL